MIALQLLEDLQEALLMRHLLQLQFLDAQETEQYDVPATAYGDFVSPYKEHARQSGSNPSQISSVAGNKTNSAGATSRSAGSILCLLLQLDPKRHRRKAFLRVHIPLRSVLLQVMHRIVVLKLFQVVEPRIPL